MSILNSASSCSLVVRHDTTQKRLSPFKPGSDLFLLIINHQYRYFNIYFTYLPPFAVLLTITKDTETVLNFYGTGCISGNEHHCPAHDISVGFVITSEYVLQCFTKHVGFLDT